MNRVNIIGAGLAGLSAALTLAEQNIGVNLISLQASERAQSVLAEGGINGALDVMGEEDNIDQVIMAIERGTYVQIENMDVRTIELVEDERGFRTR